MKNEGIITLALVCAVALIICSMVGFRVRVNQDIRTEMRSQIEAIQKSCIRELQNEMNYLKRLNETSVNFMNGMDFSSGTDIAQVLEGCAETGDIEQMAIVTLDGRVYAGYPDGTGTSDVPLLLNGMKPLAAGETVFSQPRYSENMNEVVFGVITPVTISGSEGVLISAYSVARFYGLFQNEFLGGEAEIGILNRKGETVLGRQTEDHRDEFGLNIFDSLVQSETVFSRHSVEGMRQDLEYGKAGFSSYYVEGTERYCSYAPVEGTDWFVVVMARESVLRSQSAQLEKRGVRLTVNLVSIMAVLLLVILTVRYQAQKQVREILKKAAMLDGLTGLYNRATAEAEIGSYLESDGKNGTHILFLMDIDYFKGINDRYGHFVGDLALKELARRLKDSFSEQDIIGRMGGDEFIMLMKNCADEQAIRAKASLLAEPFCLEEDGVPEPVLITVSIGIARYDADGLPFLELYQHADSALYQTKQRGRKGYSFYQ